MVDTLMVLWTRGICNRFLQTLATFLCLFTAICVLIFLVTASGVKWQGLAVTVAPAGTSSAQATSRSTSAPVSASLKLPPILQNPTVQPRPRVHHVVTETPVSEQTATPDTQSTQGNQGNQMLFP